ncbi:MAG: MgtC/SapB family protein [Armatimonadota bacterium]
MTNNELITMVLRLLLAVVLGGLIGLEREAHGRPAGLRTHILVSLGAALFTIISQSYTGARSDPSRIASQIVSGIGFLGAGTIIRQGSIIRGLTTAASLWTTAAIGMAVGAGGSLIYLAIVSSVIVFLTLSIISRLENAMISRQSVRDLVVVFSQGRAGVMSVLEAFSRYGVTVTGVRSEETESEAVETRFSVRLPAGIDISAINHDLVALSEIRSFTWD